MNANTAVTIADDTIMADPGGCGNTITYPYPWTTTPWTCDRCNCSPCICTSTVNTILHVPAPTEKVRLSPAELDTLRKAAAKDDDLRAVLQKLRGKIEVEVDFGP